MCCARCFFRIPCYKLERSKFLCTEFSAHKEFNQCCFLFSPLNCAVRTAVIHGFLVMYRLFRYFPFLHMWRKMLEIRSCCFRCSAFDCCFKVMSCMGSFSIRRWQKRERMSIKRAMGWSVLDFGIRDVPRA